MAQYRNRSCPACKADIYDCRQCWDAYDWHTHADDLNINAAAKGESRVLFHCLQASHEVIQAANRLEVSHGTNPVRPGSQPASKLARGAAAHKQLLGQEVHAEQYLRLLCQFDPPAVLPFLQSHDSYQCGPSLRGLCLHLGKAARVCIICLKLPVRYAPAVDGYEQLCHEACAASRVERCIAWCHQYGIRDGEAYLLEHFLGDYAAAMQLHVTNIDE